MCSLQLIGALYLELANETSFSNALSQVGISVCRMMMERLKDTPYIDVRRNDWELKSLNSIGIASSSVYIYSM